MRVYVTVDIEGIAGVVHSEEGSKGNPEYERARRLMTGEASAVVQGILDADSRAEVTVVDVHGPYRNIIPEELHDQATFEFGAHGRPLARRGFLLDVTERRVAESALREAENL